MLIVRNRIVVALALAVVALGSFFVVSEVSKAANPHINTGTHTAGGRTCDYLGYSFVGQPTPSSTLSYTQIQTPSCSNIYAELFARSYRCNATYTEYYSDWVSSPPSGVVQYATFPASDRCTATGPQHRISITGPDVSPNEPTFAP